MGGNKIPLSADCSTKDQTVPSSVLTHFCRIILMILKAFIANTFLLFLIKLPDHNKLLDTNLFPH